MPEEWKPGGGWWTFTNCLPIIIYPSRVNIKMMAGHGLDSAGSRQGQVRGFCEHGNEYSHSIICVWNPSTGWGGPSQEDCIK